MKSVAEKIVNPLLIRDCGLADYREVLQLQHELREKRGDGKIPNTVLIVEHTPVITLGARQSANKLLVSREELAEQHIDVVDIRRGGGTTAHNPGQLIFYPIIHLQELGLSITEYIRELEMIGIELLQQLGIKSQKRKGFPGLWVRKREARSKEGLATENTKDRKKELKLNSAVSASSAVKEKRDTRYEIRDTKKIASIGVRVSKHVTYHGMAINIQNDLSIFDFIIPCGLNGIEMTSVLRETGQYYSMNELKKRLEQLLVKHFSYHIERRATPFQNLVEGKDKRRKLPPWLRRPLPTGKTYKKVENILSSLSLETICNNANCPNRGECWSRGTATVLILGNVCTRNCKFCSVATGKPALPDPTEPLRLAEMAKQMRLKYLVITSVDRDDLPDGGASHFRDCISQVRKQCPDMRFEILTPDFRNCQARAIEILQDALPFVFAHNIEMVPALYRIARTGGDYQRSLNLLKMAKETLRFAQGDSFEIVTKSSIMLGLGETDAQVEQVLKDLRSVGCDRITIGQYLKPSKDSLDVAEYISPSKFDFWKQKAIESGFFWIISSPFARSSYFAEKEHAL